LFICLFSHVYIFTVCYTDEAQEAEAIQVLNAIFDIWEQQASKKPELIAKITHALAMLYFMLQDLNKVNSVYDY